MNVLTGLLIIIVVFGAMYYLSQQGFFAPLSQAISAIFTGFDASYFGTGYAGTAPKTSSYYRNLVIRFVSLGEGQSELKQVILVAHPKDLGYLNVTGWKLKTNKGTFKIPATYNSYSPSTKDALPENIVMREGDRLYLISGKSPTGKDERVSAGEWHVFMGDFLSFPHDQLVLKDASSSLVDKYEY